MTRPIIVTHVTWPPERPAHVGRARYGRDVVRLLRPLAARQTQEVFWVLPLDADSHALAIVEVARGTVLTVTTTVTLVFRAAVLYGAHGLYVAHCHVGTDAIPSEEDEHVTRELLAAGHVLHLPLLDHLIIATHGVAWHSMRHLRPALEWRDDA